MKFLRFSCLKKMSLSIMFIGSLLTTHAQSAPNSFLSSLSNGITSSLTGQISLGLLLLALAALFSRLSRGKKVFFIFIAVTAFTVNAVCAKRQLPETAHVGKIIEKNK